MNKFSYITNSIFVNVLNPRPKKKTHSPVKGDENPEMYRFSTKITRLLDALTARDTEEESLAGLVPGCSGKKVPNIILLDLPFHKLADLILLFAS